MPEVQDELSVARRIAEGSLDSPQHLGKMALFALRVSGTGVSYRSKFDEFVWRDPEIYLSQEMIDRCAGVPVIMEHPKGDTLNSKEFSDRVVGTLMFGYAKDDELWGIARIYDEDATKIMKDEPMSTSPGVVMRGSDNQNIVTEDGSKLLIEGKPFLLDHLAICERGVWDKGGEPTGVQADAVAKADSDVRCIIPSHRVGLDSSKLGDLAVSAELLRIRMDSHMRRHRL